jgi:hypothetical protein
MSLHKKNIFDFSKNLCYNIYIRIREIAKATDEPIVWIGCSYPRPVMLSVD